jgi:ribosomal protein S21
MSDEKKEKKVIILPENVLIDSNFERMLKSFKKQMEKDGILELVKKRRYYIKKSELKRNKLKERIRKNDQTRK